MHLRAAEEEEEGAEDVDSERASSLVGMRRTKSRMCDCGYQGNIQQLWTFYVSNILCTSPIHGSCPDASGATAIEAKKSGAPRKGKFKTTTMLLLTVEEEGKKIMDC